MTKYIQFSDLFVAFWELNKTIRGGGLLPCCNRKTGDIMARIPSGMRKKENGLFEKRFTVEGKRYLRNTVHRRGRKHADATENLRT